MNKKHLLLIAASLVALGALAELGTRARAEGIPSPNPLYYAGTLAEAGQPVNGVRAMTVNLWPDATSQGTPLCSTVASNAQVVNGRFRIALSSTCKGAINLQNSAYVEVIDGATSLGRSPVGAVPYAVEADHAVKTDVATSATTAASATTATNATNAAVASSMATASVRVATGTACATDCGNGCFDCTCQSNEVAISGGAFAGQGDSINGNQQGTSYGGSLQTWRVSCVDSTGARVACADPFAVCLRVQ
jgi:hypothetical protein